MDRITFTSKKIEKMYYISAQPAEDYFFWQLEIQIQNFKDIGINPRNIHILLSFKPEEGIPLNFSIFANENRHALFFFYPDNRTSSKYLSSIRPHILKQHFERFPELSKKVIFYHDSDIIFRERLDENKLASTEDWYFSDTRNYVGASYLKRFGKNFFEDLCYQAQIDPLLVEENEPHSGGAQHIMKGVTSFYWENVERDSEKIYIFLKNYNSQLKNKTKPVQAWCADMWAVLWNAWKLGKKVRLHSELDFSWPKDEISRFYKTKILHNAGVLVSDKKDFFCKLLFKKSTPYFVDFSSVKTDSTSIKFVEKIQELAQQQKKIHIEDFTLILHIRHIHSDQQERIKQYVNYIFKHLDIDIHIIDTCDWPTFNKNLIHGKATYMLLTNKNPISQYIKRSVKSNNFIYTVANILIPIENLLSTISILKRKEMALILPSNEIIDLLVYQYNRFKDTLIIDYPQNRSYQPVSSLDYIECFAMSKKYYIKSGGENLKWFYFQENGINLERQLRCRLLGYQIFVVDKPAFKLFSDEKRNLYKEHNSVENYLATCVGDRDSLTQKLSCQNFNFSESISSGYIVYENTTTINPSE